jgi:hypothetical protein
MRGLKGPLILAPGQIDGLFRGVLSKAQGAAKGAMQSGPELRLLPVRRP